MRWYSRTNSGFVLFLGFFVLSACAALGTAATTAAVPVAIDAGKRLIDSVVRYAESRGKKPDQVNCEEEWHPKEGLLLILCEVKTQKETTGEAENL